MLGAATNMTDPSNLRGASHDAHLRQIARDRQLERLAQLGPRRAEYLPALEQSIHPGYRFPWRIAECPGVGPRRLVDDDLAAMRAILEPYATPTFLQQFTSGIPERYRRPDGAVFPRFIATDFQRSFDPASGRLVRNVPEIQSFPGNMLLKPTKLAAFARFLPSLSESQFFLDRRFGSFDAYRAHLRRLVLGDHAPADTVILEVKPLTQSTVVDMLLWCRLLGAALVDVLDIEPDPATGELRYRNAVLFEGPVPRTVTFDRPRVAKNVLSRCIPPELDQLVDDRTQGFDEERLRSIFVTSIERGAAAFIVHPQDFFVLSKVRLVGNAAHHPRIELFEPDLLARLDAAGIPLESGVLKPAYFAGGQGVQGVSTSLRREDLLRACATIDRERRAETTVLGALRKTWLWQPRYSADPLPRQEIRGFVPAGPDDEGPIYHEIRYMWSVEVEGPGEPPRAFTPLVGMTRWSRVGLPANASYQKSAFTGTQGYLVED